ncbi:hypothetical protein ACQY0O_001058 [Thecaphora frezii]
MDSRLSGDEPRVLADEHRQKFSQHARGKAQTSPAVDVTGVRPTELAVADSRPARTKVLVAFLIAATGTPRRWYRLFSNAKSAFDDGLMYQATGNDVVPTPQRVSAFDAGRVDHAIAGPLPRRSSAAPAGVIAPRLRRRPSRIHCLSAGEP